MKREPQWAHTPAMPHAEAWTGLVHGGVVLGAVPLPSARLAVIGTARRRASCEDQDEEEASAHRGSHGSEE